MQIITTAIIKGGTGKTATAAAIAQAAKQDGRRVLAIDLDPQANLTYALGADPTQPGAVEVLEGAAAKECIQATAQGIDCIAAAPDLAQIQTKTGSAKRLAIALQPVKNKYSLIVIDTPPTMGELQNNALMASTELVIPLEADTNSLQGMYNIADIASHIQAANSQLHIAGIVVTRYDGRPKLNRYLLEQIQQAADESGIPFLGVIRAGVAVKEAAAMQANLFEYAPKSKPAEDYNALYTTLKRR